MFERRNRVKTEKTEPNKEKQPEAPQKLNYKSFQGPDDLCDYINEHKIKPLSLNVTDRFYIVFYYEKQ